MWKYPVELIAVDIYTLPILAGITQLREGTRSEISTASAHCDNTGGRKGAGGWLIVSWGATDR